MACRRLVMTVRKVWADFEQALDQLQQLEEQIAQERAQFLDDRAKLEIDREQLNEERRCLEAEKTAMKKLGIGSNDLVGLNLRGEKVVMVRRSLFCQAQASMLAVMFSGRYDDQLDLDRDGNIFLDYPPAVIMPLIDWLTACRNLPPGTQPPDITDVAIPGEYASMWDGVVRFYGLESTAQPSSTVFSGVKTNLKFSDLDGWNITFCKPYSHKTTLADFQLPEIDPDCAVLMGARKTGTDELILAAIGRLDMITAEKTVNCTQFHNGVHWYCAPNISIGFAPNATVQMQRVDIHDLDCPLRLSWSLTGSGGWRAGSLTELHHCPDIEKVIMTPQRPLRIDT